MPKDHFSNNRLLACLSVDVHHRQAFFGAVGKWSRRCHRPQQYA